MVPRRSPIAALSRGRHLVPIAHVGDPVGGVDHDRVPARLENPPAKIALARPVAVDLGVLAEAIHQVRDFRPEALAQLGELDVGVLDHVVQVGGRDHRAAIAGIQQQVGDRDRMLDELLVGLLAVLPEMDAASESKGGTGELRASG